VASIVDNGELGSQRVMLVVSVRVPFVVTTLALLAPAQEPFAPDESPGSPGEWGFRPTSSIQADRNPPAFVWRPQADAIGYDWQAARDASFTDEVRERSKLLFPALRPAEPFAPGSWHWRFRFHRSDGRVSEWSTARRFAVSRETPAVGIPTFDVLRARVPEDHPRLFVRPEQHERLRALANGRLAPSFDRLRKRCENTLAKPPTIDEPPRYPKGTVRGSEEWREIWWGNRRRTIAVLEPAAQLAFTYWLTGETRYADAARRLLMAAAAWDPRGATGYRYNDEAGMPYAYWFART
jgi:hypothetical protein